jgi:hypothetical protein
MSQTISKRVPLSNTTSELNSRSHPKGHDDTSKEKQDAISPYEESEMIISPASLQQFADFNPFIEDFFDFDFDPLVFDELVPTPSNFYDDHQKQDKPVESISACKFDWEGNPSDLRNDFNPQNSEWFHDNGFPVQSDNQHFKENVPPNLWCPPAFQQSPTFYRFLPPSRTTTENHPNSMEPALIPIAWLDLYAKRPQASATTEEIRKWIFDVLDVASTGQVHAHKDRKTPSLARRCH